MTNPGLFTPLNLLNPFDLALSYGLADGGGTGFFAAGGHHGSPRKPQRPSQPAPVQYGTHALTALKTHLKSAPENSHPEIGNLPDDSENHF